MPKTAGEPSRSVQDYLRALLLHSGNDDPVSTGEISRYFGIAPASVTQMLRKLAEDGYAYYARYHGTTLTPRGVREAQRITRKHRLLEKFLLDILHVRKDRVHSQACEMEHTLSDDAEEVMCRLLNHPDRCPDDGQIIPACDLSFSSCEECMKVDEDSLEGVEKRRENLISMGALKAGTSGRVSFIRGDRGIIRRLRDLGLTAGAHVKVEKVGPRMGRLQVSVRGSNAAIARGIAAKIFVEVSG